MRKKSVYGAVLVIFITFLTCTWLVLSQKYRQELNIKMCRNLIEASLLEDDKLCHINSRYDTFRSLFRSETVDVNFVKVAMKDYALYEESNGDCLSGEPGTVLNYGVGNEAPWGGYPTTVEFIFCNNQLVQYFWYD